MKKLRWGILSTAKIAREKVIPAMQAASNVEIVAIASRSHAQALQAASACDIGRAYGSYDELLAAPDVDAVYIPLPNHLHVPFSLMALKQGKHVLCEKPIGLDAADARRLQDATAASPQLLVMEAFMYRFHPQWQHAREAIRSGCLGTVRTIHSFFSYHNIDPDNVRNQVELGGGGLMDIGCYCVSLARFLYEGEPVRATATMVTDPDFGTDQLTSAMLDFSGRTATFTCSTQLTPYQRVSIFGDTGRLELEIPFNAPEHSCRSWLDIGGQCTQIDHPPCNQYTLQAEIFSEAVLHRRPVPVSLDDAVANMVVIDGLRRSAQTGTWINFNT